MEHARVPPDFLDQCVENKTRNYIIEENQTTEEQGGQEQ
jgi:hypothetical protein